jgi:hypothetical protein
MMDLRRKGLLLLGLLAISTAGMGGEDVKKSELEAERAKAAAARIKAMETARKSFVKVVFTPKWEEECALEASASGSRYSRQTFWQGYGGSVVSRMRNFMGLHRQKRKQTSVGLLIGKGLVMLVDDGNGYEWKLIKSIEAIDAAGKRYELERHKLLTAASALLFKVKGADAPAGVAFRNDFKFSPTAQLYGATLSREYIRPSRWFIVAGGSRVPFDAKPASVDRLSFAAGSSGMRGAYGANLLLMMDDQGRPVGVNVGRMTLDNRNRTAWAVKDILEKGTVSFSRAHKAEKAATAQSLKLHYKLRFEFRVDKDGDDSSRWGGRGGGASNQDAETYGFSIGGGKLLVPRTLKLALLRKIEKVSIKIGEEWKKAKFVVALKNIDGMLIEAPEVKLNVPEGLYATKGVKMMQPFVFCTVRELLGETNAFAKVIRYAGKQRGYKEKIRPMASEIPAGSLLFDLDGKLAGICVRERRDPSVRSLGGGSGGYYGGDSMKNLVPFSKLKATFEKPKDFSHPTWRPMSKQESKRLIWLGVEFDRITKELAKTLKVKKPTRGGAIGYMVSSVYPKSPAEKLGIKSQDILLRLEIKGLGDPMHLVAGGGAGSGYRGRYGGGRGGRTWRPRINAITLILTTAGPGYEAEIVYYSFKEKKIKKASWKLAYGPLDFDSADKYKDEKLGLSIKPLTYEVRRALAMTAESPGVIISKVERGSAAQLARLGPYVVITHIEGEPVKSVDEFKKKIAELRKEKKEKTKLTVSIMGKSRFADLKLED